jgi:hypothetical protein
MDALDWLFWRIAETQLDRWAGECRLYVLPSPGIQGIFPLPPEGSDADRDRGAAHPTMAPHRSDLAQRRPRLRNRDLEPLTLPGRRERAGELALIQVRVRPSAADELGVTPLFDDPTMAVRGQVRDVQVPAGLHRHQGEHDRDRPTLRSCVRDAILVLSVRTCIGEGTDGCCCQQRDSQKSESSDVPH